MLDLSELKGGDGGMDCWNPSEIVVCFVVLRWNTTIVQKEEEKKHSSVVRSLVCP